MGMFIIDPTSYVDPFRYPGRLLICLCTGDRPHCGLFSGLDFFREDQRTLRQPVVQVEDWSGNGLEVFEVLDLPRGGHQVLQHEYLAISWKEGAASGYPLPKMVTIRVDGQSWSVLYDGVTLQLD